MDLVLCDLAAIKFVALNEKKQQLVVACCYLFLFFSLAEIEQLVKEAKAGDYKKKHTHTNRMQQKLRR